VTAARIAAAHEGVAELVVTLTYPGGGTTEVALDELATRTLMTACAARDAEGLIGASWEAVRDALTVAWNRYNTADSGAHSPPGERADDPVE